MGGGHRISISRILVVDDQELVVRVTTLHLEALGYSVLSCLEPKLALAEFEKDPFVFDFLVTDYAMPVMSGLDLAEDVWKLRSDLPIVFMTGYGEDLAFKVLALPGPATILHKPFRRDALKTALETARADVDGPRGKILRGRPTLSP